jgi:hypothetical protein
MIPAHKVVVLVAQNILSESKKNGCQLFCEIPRKKKGIGNILQDIAKIEYIVIQLLAAAFCLS